MAEEIKIIKKQKKKLKQQIVLERVIKQIYETLSDNFAKTHEAFRQLALKRVKEKKKMKNIVNENNKWWRIARQFKIKNKLLKYRMVNRSPLQILAKTAEFLGNDQLKQKSKIHQTKKYFFLRNYSFHRLRRQNRYK